MPSPFNNPLYQLYHLYTWILSGLALMAAPALALDSNSPENRFFESRIRPLFEESCIECHGPEKQKGGLRLDYRGGWEMGGESGPALVPGDLAESRIIHAVHYEDADFQMPPKNKLSAKAIADLEEWVAMGAPDPRTEQPKGPAATKQAGMSIEEGRQFWSFRPIAKPNAPSIQDNSWAKNEIDRFIRAKQEEQGLKPSKPASKSDLARRAYFSLIGLPPTPEQIDAFVSDPSPDAFDHLVDGLLDSPHFGERWGRHWLDVARFAESSGGGRTLLFKDAWRYRDYVIESFNANTPFDQFIREQLAGDLLPYDSPAQQSRQLTATAFLALGPTNYEQQDKQLLRYDVIDEQIDTVGKAFLGMTLGCARCHDHKFDPVPTSDYYALAGIFKSTRTLFNYTDNVARWVDTPLPLEGEAAEALAESLAKNAALKPQLDLKKSELNVLSQLNIKAPDPGLPKQARQFPGIVMDDSSATVQGDWRFSQFSQNYLGEGYLHDGNSDKGDKSLTFETTIPVTGRYEVRLAYSPLKNRSTRTPVTIEHAQGESTVQVNQQLPTPEYGRFLSLGEFNFEEESLSSITVSTNGTDGYVVADAVQWFLLEEETESKSPEREGYLATLKGEIKTLEIKLKPITNKLKARPIAMSVKEDPEPSNSAIRIRGIESRKGEVVPRGFLQVALYDGAPEIPRHASGRAELAEWIADPRNPLTARVMANRIWSWLFGQGIVRSVDNMGTTGESPSHPKLLAYLASKFQENGWSVKALIREIVLSQTWQQSTEPNSDAIQNDASNRLLTHYPKRRLDAEQLRDAILATNGRLDLTLLGPNIEGAGEINANSTAAQTIEYNYVFKDKRRSVYTPAFRVNRHELFELFDFGNANFSIGQRNTSTVALQALYLLNNPFVIEQSHHAAKKLLKETSDPHVRINIAFRSTLGRDPTDKERHLVTAFLKDGQFSDSVEDWASLYQTLFGTIDFRYLN
jgi:cytochrome c553